MFNRSILVLLAILAVCAAEAGEPWRILLDADFDDQPLDTPIGFNGAASGQPVSMQNGLSAIVRSGLFATPNLELSQTNEGLARYVRFHFLDNAEPRAGHLMIEIELRPLQLDHYVVALRENLSSADSFGMLVLEANGNVRFQDGEGSQTIDTYAADTILRTRWVYDLSAGTYDLFLDDVQVLDDRAHGIDMSGPDADGIGAVLIGLGSESTLSAGLCIDNLRVDWLPPDAVFLDGFEVDPP